MICILVLTKIQKLLSVYCTLIDKYLFNNNKKKDPNKFGSFKIKLKASY